MPKMSGSFVGRVNSQAMATVKDVPNHELGLVQISGPQKVSDLLWGWSHGMDAGIADLVSGNGTQTGYYVNEHPNGDTRLRYIRKQIATAGGAVTTEGTWKRSGGTGAFTGITGSGTYKGVTASPTEIETKWEGAYQLG